MKKVWFNFEARENWMWSAFDISFAEGWPTLQDYIMNDQILILSLEFRPGRFPLYKEADVNDLERWGLSVSSIVNVDDYTVCWQVSKSDMGKLCCLSHPPGIHWIDCAVTSSSELIRKVYAEYFRDDMFEEQLTHELAIRLGSSITFFSTGLHETRIEYKDKSLGQELLALKLRNLFQSLGLERRIEFTTGHLDQLVQAALTDPRPMSLDAKGIQITQSGFNLIFKGHSKNFLLEI